MKKKIILTGDRPTGKLHVGHYIGSLKNRVKLQNSGEYHPFIMIADTQALTDNARNPEKIQKSLIQVALDYLAVGIDPQVSTVFVQSQIPALFELTAYYMDLVTVSRLERNPTVKAEIKQKGFDAKTVEQKVMSMYTDPQHIHVEDPGKVEGNTVFTYLDIFDPDKDKVAQLKADYQKGGLGDVKIKRYLNSVLENELAPIRERRAKYEQNTSIVYDMLIEGSKKANEVADQTLQEVRDAIGLNYFKR